MSRFLHVGFEDGINEMPDKISRVVVNMVSPAVTGVRYQQCTACLCHFLLHTVRVCHWL
jgi:hypothetical protein